VTGRAPWCDMVADVEQPRALSQAPEVAGKAGTMNRPSTCSPLVRGRPDGHHTVAFFLARPMASSFTAG
jgi:hypothetical protein